MENISQEGRDFLYKTLQEKIREETQQYIHGDISAVQLATEAITSITLLEAMDSEIPHNPEFIQIPVGSAGNILSLAETVEKGLNEAGVFTAESYVLLYTLRTPGYTEEWLNDRLIEHDITEDEFQAAEENMLEKLPMEIDLDYYDFIAAQCKLANKNLWEKELLDMAKSPDADIRSLVASYSSNEEVLKMLTHDEDEGVLKSLVTNGKASVSIQMEAKENLNKLKEDIER